MYLINSKTGKPEELSDEDMKAFERGDKPKRAGLRPNQQSKAGREQRPSKLTQRAIDTDDSPQPDGSPKITRSSDYKKKPAKTSWGANKALPGEYTRTSDRKSKYKPRDPERPRKKPEQSALQYAGWLLKEREYSAAVLRRKLVTRGYSEQEADVALEHLQRMNFQSDERYSEMKTRQMEHRYGNFRIEAALQQKGIAKDLAASTVEQMESEEDRVIAVAEKFRNDVVQAGMTQDLRQKIYNFLMRRGFSSRSVRVAIAHLTSSND